MNNLPSELVTHIITNVYVEDIGTFCSINKKIHNVCVSNRTTLLRQFMKKSEDLDDSKWYLNFRFLFETKEQLYKTAVEVGAKYILELISEEYPVNQHNSLLVKFSKIIASDWKRYIHISPEIVLLIVAHHLKKMVKSDLEFLKQKVPKKLISQIKEYEVDWFNTDNGFADVICNFLK